MWPRCLLRGWSNNVRLAHRFTNYRTINTDEARMKSFEELMRRRFFYDNSCAIYGSMSGMYDFGPTATSIKWNLQKFWREFFVSSQSDIYQIDTSSILLEKALVASGHTEKFQDILIRDSVTGQCLRCDHLFIQLVNTHPKLTDEEKNQLKIDSINWGPDQFSENMKKYNFTKNPDTGNPLSEPFYFNLMFQTKIGAEGKQSGYMRPELAQGIFVNFPRLFEQNGEKLPFGVSCVGNAYRNEASPRQGLLRTREFTLAEIEYFFDPKHASHDGLEDLLSVKIPIYSVRQQEENKPLEWVSLNELLHSKQIENEIFLFFLGKIFMFLQHCSIDCNRIRFRQHFSNEMAHYAADCWDVEIHSTRYGWIECIGIANRTNFDLTQHGIHSGQERALQALSLYPDGPKYVSTLQVKPIQPHFGKLFRNQASSVLKAISALSDVELQQLKETHSSSGQCSILVDGENINIPANTIEFSIVQESKSGEYFYPSVIEPSFGISRILYCIFEHNFKVRQDDEQRTVLSLPNHLASCICYILPLHPSDKSFKQLTKQISKYLLANGIECKTDDAGQSIGKRYARTDEIGVPFTITVDRESIIEAGLCKDFEDATVTLRDRDSTEQIRVKVQLLVRIFEQLKSSRITFQYLAMELGTVERKLE